MTGSTKINHVVAQKLPNFLEYVNTNTLQSLTKMQFNGGSYKVYRMKILSELKIFMNI